MSYRLDIQRPARRFHKRKNYRWYRRGYSAVPHPVWGDYGTGPGVVTGPPPTGVTRGSPGAFTPAGCDVPGNLAELTALGALGQTVAWTAGQYVNLDPVGSAYWNGTAWALGVGVGLLLDDPHVVNPGNFTVADIQDWIDDHPILEVAQALRDHEANGQARVTLLTWLDGFIESLDGVDP